MPGPYAMQANSKILLLSAISCSLIACGGSSESSPFQSFSGKSTITTENSTDISMDAMKAAFSVLEQGSIGDLLSIGSGDAPNSPALALLNTSGNAQKISNYINLPCFNSDANFRLTLTDNDPEGVVGSEDSIAIEQDNCQILGTTLLGNATASIDSFNSVYDFSASLDYDNFGVDFSNELVSLDGSITIAFSNSSGDINYDLQTDSLTVRNGSETYTLRNYTANHNINAGNFNYAVEFELDSSEFEGTLRVNTDTAFSGSLSNFCPSTGMLTITDGNNSNIQVSANDGNSVFVTADIDGAVTTETVDCNRF